MPSRIKAKKRKIFLNVMQIKLFSGLFQVSWVENEITKFVTVCDRQTGRFSLSYFSIHWTKTSSRQYACERILGHVNSRYKSPFLVYPWVWVWRRRLHMMVVKTFLSFFFTSRRNKGKRRKIIEVLIAVSQRCKTCLGRMICANFDSLMFS